MPVYEYCCKACGHEFEREQRITEDPIKTCPKCRAARAKRMISRTSFVLKGGGWYSDLYSSSGGKKEAGSGDGADKTSSKDSGSSSDSSGGDKPKGKSSGSGGKSSGKGKSGKKSAA